MSPRAPLGDATAPLPAHVDFAIIGGGVMGLATAYNLLRLRPTLRVAVIERSYLVAGASGRNGGGVRMQWGDAANVRVMLRSIELVRDLTQMLGINVWFRQGGYLFLARSEASERALLRNADLHREVGAPTRLLSASEARELVPQLRADDVRVASFNPEDGVVFPWAFVWGYAQQATRLGAVIRTHTQVTRLEQGAGNLVLHTDRGERLVAQRVINATGAWSHALNAQVGLHLPNHPHNHEILTTEPLRPWLGPLLVDLSTGLYASQSTRGELVAGITMFREESHAAALQHHSSNLFLGNISRALVGLMPQLQHVKVLRQWAGPYDVSPDGDAIVGPTRDLPNLIQLCGFTGHGFMMAPAVGELLARNLVLGEPHELLQRWRPDRFNEAGTPSARHEDMIIG